MKKYNKIKSKTPVKQEEKNKQDYTDTITQIYNETEYETEYIYVIDPQRKNLVKARNTDETEILNQTLKMETKTVKIFGNEFNQEKIDLISSEKKIKKKKMKKKKKSVKKDITPYGESENAGQNTVNGIEVGIPTPNGNDGGENFFLIDYQSRNQKECNGINEPNPMMTEDNYNTFHENELESNAEPKAVEEPAKTENNDIINKYDISSISNASDRAGDSQRSHRSHRKDIIYPKKLSFDIAEKPKNENNDQDEVKHDKLRRIRFRNRDDIKKDKTTDLNTPKKNENEKDKDKEKENLLKNDASDDNINEKDKDKEKGIKSSMVHKKKKKMAIKKKVNTNVNKVVLIQSFWRRYKARKLVKLNKNFEELTFIFNLLMNKRLKTNLQFLFEQMNSIISNDNNNIDNINIINTNKIQKDKKRKKIKTKKIKIKNPSGKNINSSPEKENSFKIINDDKIDNDNLKKSTLFEEDKKLFINNEDEESSYPNKKDSGNTDNNDDYYLLKDHSTNNTIKNSTYNEIKNGKIKDNNDDNQTLAQSQKEPKSNNHKTKSKLKLVEIQRKNKNDKRNTSFDNATEKKYTKPEVKPPSLKRKVNKSVDMTPSVNYDSIPVISNELLNMSFSKNKFLNDSLINCHNDELSFISPQRKVSYYKKVIGENPFSKQKSKKGSKTDFSAIKFALSLKEIISKIIKKNNFYYLIGYLNAKSLLQNMMNICQKKKKSILKNTFDKYKIRAQILKILENTKNAKKMHKKQNLKISNIKPIFIGKPNIKNKKSELFNENCIESNELTIIDNCNKKRSKSKGNKINKFGDEKLILSENVCNVKINNKIFRKRIRVDKNVASFKIKKSYEKEDVFNKNKLKISKIIPSFEISKQIKENILSIDKITDFKIRESYQKENKFKENKLIMTKCISKVKINKQKTDNNKFIIDKIISKFNIRESYKKETKFNNNKLIIAKTIPKININKSRNENWKFIIDKVISKFNIRDIKKPKQLIITKLIKESPIINMVKKSINDNLVITKVINNINIKGILKNNNHVINKVNDDCIIDDIDAYNKENKIKYYYSLIMNNINNLFINNIVTDFMIISKKTKSILSITNNEFHIKSNKKANYIITKNINDYILGNNLILKYLYNFNQNKLIINKVNHVNIKPEDKTKRQIAYSTSLSKVKSIITNNIHKLIYPLLTNMMKKKAFCYHVVKFNKMNINLMKIMFINNIKNAILEEKYKKIYMNKKFNNLVINTVLNYDIYKNDNKIEEYYANIKNKNFIKGNVITKTINLFIENNKENQDLSIDKSSEIISKKHHTPLNSPNYSEDIIKNKNKSKVYISRLKMSNSKNYNNLNNITNNLKNKRDNQLNNNNNNSNKSNIINNNHNSNLSNSNNSINTNILSNTFTNIGSLSKIKQYFPLNSSPRVTYNKIVYSRKKTNDEKVENKSKDKDKNVKEKKLDFNRNIYKDLEEIQKQKDQKKLLKEITAGQSKEEKEADEQEEEEVESTKDNLKFKDKNSKNQQKKYEEKEEEEERDEKVYYQDGSNNKYRNNTANKNNVNNIQKESTYEEEEEEEEFEEEEEESDYLEDVKEILLKYIAKKNNIIYKKLLSAFRKWKSLLNNNPIIYNKYKNMRKAQKKVNKNEIAIYDNGAIDKNKKLFIIYRKYNDYSYVMKKKCLRKWKKLIELYDNENVNDNEEIEYDEEEDEEIEDEEEEEEIEKSE